MVCTQNCRMKKTPKPATTKGRITEGRVPARCSLVMSM